MSIILKRQFPFIFQQKAIPLPSLPPVRTSDPYLTVVNGFLTGPPDNKRSYLDNGYNINDIIYSIVTLITEKVKLAPWAPYLIVDEEALKAMNAILSKKNFQSGDFTQVKELRKKALEPYDKDQKLRELLMWPNPNQTFQDLVADSSLYKLLTGDRLIWAEILAAGANGGKPNALYVLPSQDISLVVTKAWPQEILYYRLDPVSWDKLRMEPVEILHDKYFNPNSDINGGHLMGMSPLKSALGRLTRSNAENQAATMSYQNGGPKTLIYVDEQGMPAEGRATQATEIKRILTSGEYSGPGNYNKLAASGWKMGAVPIGLSPADLDIIASEQNTLRFLCSIYMVPSQMVNDSARSTYNTVTEAEAALTTKCALPLLNSFKAHFNRKLRDWGYPDKNLCIDYDLTPYSELQEDMGKKWEWVKQLPVPNGYKLDLMGLDHPDGQDEFMDQILIPSGYELSESFTQSQTDTALAEGDGEVAEDDGGKEMQSRAIHNGHFKAELL